MSPNHKLIHLEALRGLAALIVVASHYATAFYPASVFGSSYQAHEPWESLFTTTPLGLVFAAHFAVCLFFILSGYVLSLPYFGESKRGSSDLLAAILKRPFRLGGLVLATILVAIFLEKVNWFYNESVSEISFSTPWFSDFWSSDLPRLRRVILELTTRMFATGAQYNPPLWTIQMELYGSFLVYLFLLLFRKSSFRIFVYVYAFVFFHGSLYHGFVFGMLMADVVKNYPHATRSRFGEMLAWPSLAGGLLLASYPFHLVPNDLAQTYYGSLPQIPLLGGGYAMLGALIVFTSVLLSPRIQRVLSHDVFAFLGRISYAIYVSHFLLLGSLSSWAFLYLSSRFSYNVSFMIVFAASLGILVAVSYMMTVAIDEPVNRLANRFAKRYLSSISE